MDKSMQVFEKYVFFSARRETETLNAILEVLLTLPVESLGVDYVDRPNQSFSSFNERAKKIIASLPDPHKIERVYGEFSEGGCFELKGGAFSIAVSSDQYNFEVIDSMRKILSHVLPMCVFRNPYIWGVDMFLDYSREDFFEIRKFATRSQKLEDPQVDIFRRDDGIICKLRFHLKSEEPEIEMDPGIKLIHGVFTDLMDALKKGAYEGLEVLHLYCTDLAALRRTDPRTKTGHKIKSLLNLR